MPKTRNQSGTKVPEFKSLEEEAAFWDHHDTTEFEAEMRPVQVKFSNNLTRGITIRLDPETLDKVRARARIKGIGPTTLIRMWVLERLREESG